MDWLDSRILEFLILFHVPLFVEVMVPEQIDVGICLVVTLVVDTFERVGTQFALFGFEIERVDLEVFLAIPGKMVVVFDLMRAIVL